MANEKRLIDANALGIGKAKREVFDNPAYADGWNSAIAIIDNAPTVDAVEVVHGRWEYNGEIDHDGNLQAHCSCCGAGDKHAPCMVGNVPFCWKCGANMDGERGSDG